MEKYTLVIREPIYHLFTLLLQYVFDCICLALLPACSPDPMDNRLILACVTIKNNKVIRICNFSCRQYAGAFPSLYYWLYAVPIIPMLVHQIKESCCRPDFVGTQSPLVNDLLDLLNRIDPSGSVRQAIFGEDFALPKMYARKLEEIGDKVSLAGLAELIRPDAINLATLVDKPAGEASAIFERAGATPMWRDVASAEEVPIVKNLTAFPFASRGDKVVVYRMEGKVVGYGPYDAQENLLDKQAELKTIKGELAALRNEVETLKKRG
jgi:hypothetical protein